MSTRGTPGVPAGGGCPAQITTPGRGAMMLQVSPLGTWMEPGAEEGQPSNQGQRARGCWVPASEPSCALSNLRLRIVSSHSRAQAHPSCRQVPRRQGQSCTLDSSSGPRRLQGGPSPEEDTVLLGGQAGFSHLRDPPGVSGQVSMSPTRLQPGHRAEEITEQWVGYRLPLGQHDY